MESGVPRRRANLASSSSSAPERPSLSAILASRDEGPASFLQSPPRGSPASSSESSSGDSSSLPRSAPSPRAPSMPAPVSASGPLGPSASTSATHGAPKRGAAASLDSAPASPGHPALAAARAEPVALTKAAASCVVPQGALKRKQTTSGNNQAVLERLADSMEQTPGDRASRH